MEPTNKPEPGALNPDLDLVLERLVDISPELVWKAWTEPEHLRVWFAPAPHSVAACTVDLRPGGGFCCVMRSPEGEEFPATGCYLEVVPMERLVFTDALLAGYRPSDAPFFTAVVTMIPEGEGTRYRAVAKHADKVARDRHEEMGFHDGWSQCLDQLVAHMTAV